MQGAQQGMAVVKDTPSSAHCSPKVSKGEVMQVPVSILLLLLWMEALAGLEMRLMRHVLQLLHSWMVRLQGR